MCWTYKVIKKGYGRIRLEITIIIHQARLRAGHRRRRWTDEAGLGVFFFFFSKFRFEAGYKRVAQRLFRILFYCFLVYWTYKVCLWYAPGYYMVSVKGYYSYSTYKLKLNPLFPAGFLEYRPYKVSQIRYSLFSYSMQPAKCTSASFMSAILEEYLVLVTCEWNNIYLQ